MGDPVTRFVIRMTTTRGQFYWTNYVHNLNAFGWSDMAVDAQSYQNRRQTETRATALAAAFSRVFPIEHMEVVAVTVVPANMRIVEVLEP